eukprot:CAMPEP_0168313266 /NCGR_PEP_ID=MMETSP0210-20121227/711_1 /TAXON_ID=40633 /ORGANISM="Condylostoma magnum, Strain COL2" /LENGTH=46 /DNA_ID= /DNA_START= /DNA_END= /DNA_ORIENTATION=
MQGNGEMIYANQSIYKGQFSNDLKHGEGVMKFNDGSEYKGEFKNGV